jgi:hypothetical protein
MHHYSRHNEVHALAIANVFVVQAVRPVYNQQHLLSLAQVHVGSGARISCALRRPQFGSGSFLRLRAPGD